MAKAPLTAADIGSGPPTPAEPITPFRVRGDSEYSIEVPALGIELYISRLRRSSHELWGELTVRVNGHFPRAKRLDGQGTISTADVNLSSARGRVERAKMLQERSGSEDHDWVGLIERLSVHVIAAERQGDPGVLLSDVQERPTEDNGVWEIDGFPILKYHPTVLFGTHGSGKSYLAAWIAGSLMRREDVTVAYLDWELGPADQRERLAKLFQPIPRMPYLTCRKPLRDELERISRFIHQHGCTYAIFDSMGPASRARGGAYQDGGDPGQEYFGLVRQLGIGSLHVAHPPKNVDDEKTATVYGSAFFSYLARSIWFVQPVDNAPKGQIIMGLYHHKMTTGQKREPRAYRLIFDDNRARVERTNLKEIDELVAKLPLLDRMKNALEAGALTPKELADMLDSKPNVIRKLVSRYASTFVKLGNRIGLQTREGSDLEF